MKKIFAMVLAMLFCFTLFCACTPQDDPSGTDSSVQESTDRVIGKESNETDGSVQPTESGAGSDASSGSSIEDQEDLFDEELAAKADAVIYLGGFSAGEGDELLTKNETKFYLVSHDLLNTSFQENATVIEYPSTALKSATFTIEGVPHKVTFQTAKQLPLANCKNEALKKMGTLLVSEDGQTKYVARADTGELVFYSAATSYANTPIADDVARTRAEAVLKDLYGEDFEDEYVYYYTQSGYGSKVHVIYRRHLHGIITADALTVSFDGESLKSIDAREKDYFNGNAKNITKEMVDRAVESLRSYLGVEELNLGTCILLINEDGRCILECVYDREYFIEVK